MRRQAKVSKVTAGLHRLDLGGVNVYLIEDGRELALIDTGFPGQSGAILSAVEGLGRRPTDLRHIVLTHAHPDHVGSAAALVTATGARTYMHRLDVPIAEGRIENRPLEPAPDPLMRGLFVLLSLSKPDVDPVRIDAPVGDGDVLPIAGGLSVVHAPGHCAGQVALHWRSRGVLFVADACANLLGLRHPLGYEDRTQGLASLRRLAELDFATACFGHGRPLVANADERFRHRWRNGIPTSTKVTS